MLYLLQREPHYLSSLMLVAEGRSQRRLLLQLCLQMFKGSEESNQMEHILFLKVCAPDLRVCTVMNCIKIACLTVRVWTLFSCCKLQSRMNMLLEIGHR